MSSPFSQRLGPSPKDRAETVQRKIMEGLGATGPHGRAKTILRDKYAQVWDCYVKGDPDHVPKPTLSKRKISGLLPQGVSYELCGEGETDDGCWVAYVQFRLVPFGEEKKSRMPLKAGCL